MLYISYFKSEGKELREQQAIFVRKISTKNLDPVTLEPYKFYRLIHLNKNAGVRPIGVGELTRRVVDKTIA